MRYRVPRVRFPRTWRPGRKLPRSRSLVFLIVLILLIALRGLWPLRQTPPEGTKDAFLDDKKFWIVERVVDGDTLRLVGGETVRLIGVDAPEMVKPFTPVEPYGPEAAEFLAQVVREAGGKVRLEFDGPRRDKYGRLLAYVYAGEKLVNEEIIRAGLGRAEPEYPYSEIMKQRFLLAEREAKQARRGIWSGASAPSRGP